MESSGCQLEYNNAFVNRTPPSRYSNDFNSISRLLFRSFWVALLLQEAYGFFHSFITHSTIHTRLLPYCIFKHTIPLGFH